MWVKIKMDHIETDELCHACLNEKNTQVILSFKNGNVIFFGKEYEQGKVPKERVISPADFAQIKDFFSIELKARELLT